MTFKPKTVEEQIQKELQILRAALRNKRFLREYLQDQLKATELAISSNYEQIKLLENQLPEKEL